MVTAEPDPIGSNCRRLYGQKSALKTEVYSDYSSPKVSLEFKQGSKYSKPGIIINVPMTKCTITVFK